MRSELQSETAVLSAFMKKMFVCNSTARNYITWQKCGLHRDELNAPSYNVCKKVDTA